MRGTRQLQHLPNLITIARLLLVPALAWLAWRGWERAFAAGLIAALLSDAADGWLARLLDVASPVGAMLDTVADVAVILVALFAIWVLHRPVYLAHGWEILGVLLLWVVAHSAALIRYRRPASFHSQLVRAGIAAFSVFAVALFTIGFMPWLLHLAAIVCALGAFEQLALVYYLREWNPDLRGGIVQVLRAGRENLRS